MRVRLLLLPLLLLVGCGSTLGDDAGSASDSGPRTDAGPDARDGGPDAPDAGPDASALGADAGPTGGLVPVPEPPAPVFDDAIDTVSVAVRTGGGGTAGTDAPIEVCLNATTCLDLDTPDVNDRRVGITDALHFSGLGLTRADITEVTLRTRSDPATDNDRWTPVCLELRFDGEPVYCNDDLGVHIGTGASAGEVPSWTDADGLHQACDTCWPSTLTHGPVQGGHSSDAARFWVRADASRRVGLRMSDGALDESSPVVAWAIPTPADDFSAHFTVQGLEPATTYTFRFEVEGDAAQPTRTLRTAPADDSIEPMRFAFGSCSRLEVQPTFGALHAQAPDLFLFLGDIHYANSRHRDAHRWNYRLFRAIPERADFLANTPTISSWDDHDFVGNNSNGTCAGGDEAAAVFSEYWANPASGDGLTPGIFFRHRFGPVEVFALDCRMNRPAVDDPGQRCDVDPGVSIPLEDGPLGPGQTAWALDALESSDAPFKLLACGSRFTSAGSIDSWRSFPAARDAFFGALADRGVEGVVLLSGDIHRSEIRRVPRAGAYDLTELTSSPMAYAASSNCGAGDSDRAFCIDGEDSFLTVDVNAAASDPSLQVRVHGGDGAVRYEHEILRSSLR